MFLTLGIQAKKFCNSIFSRTILVSRQLKGKTTLDFKAARDDEMAVASAGPNANHVNISNN